MENQTQVTVVDSIMGSGKTTWIIEHLKNTRKKYIIIAPKLDMVDSTYNKLRSADNVVNEEVKGLGKEYEGRKGEYLKKLLIKGKNVIITHQLLKTIDKETMELIKAKKYELYMDETIDFYTIVDLNKNDADLLKNDGVITIHEDDSIEWLKEIDSRYNDLQNMAKHRCTYLADNKTIIGFISPEIFNIFSHIYILTYQFEYSMLKCYFDLFQITYEIKSIRKSKNGAMKLEQYVRYSGTDYKDLIQICGKSINDIGEKRTALSNNWYASRIKEKKTVAKRFITQKSTKRNLSDQEVNKENGLVVLGKNASSFYKKYCPSVPVYEHRKEEWRPTIWTTFVEYRDEVKIEGLKGKSGQSGFLAFNCKGINDYRDYQYVLYLVNIFQHPSVNRFWENRGIQFDQENYALSLMLQFIFRTRIRNSEEYGDRSIKVYIPSKRMRNLLVDWLDAKR